MLIAILLLSLLTDPSILCDAKSSTSPDSPFDQYGTISWEDEKARLDNFAIQLQNNKKCTGYILVFDKTNGCPGEATARGNPLLSNPRFYIAVNRWTADSRLSKETGENQEESMVTDTRLHVL